MLFPTIVFAIFFLVVFAGNWLLMKRPSAWKLFMLAASYFFYGYWDWRFLGLIGISTVINHLCAVGISRQESSGTRRLLLILAIVFNFGSLGFFKYYDFFVMQVYQICHGFGITCSIPLLSIILPVGISFFTFQAMTYVIDVYRRQLEPAPHLIDFAVYLAFFPQLVAGPIVRASVLLPQIIKPRAFKNIDVGRATFLIMAGLFKKIVIANYLAKTIVDPVFAFPEIYSGTDTLFAIYGYAIQIYCDFSAYSDIAIGVALLLGFHIPINFNAPYFASSIQGFWRRWHISLSTWLRDYLYIPLGGSRKSNTRTYVNLMLTFLLGGLWHGAGWTFIAWGGLHGFYLTVGRLLRRHLPKPKKEHSPGTARLIHVLKSILVIHLVCLSWIFFRAVTFNDAWIIITNFGHWTAPELLNGVVILTLVIGFMTQYLDGRRVERGWDFFNRLNPVLQGALAAVALIIILAFGPTGVAPFIYFQF